LHNLNHQEKAKADDWTVARCHTSELAQFIKDFMAFPISGVPFRVQT